MKKILSVVIILIVLMLGAYIFTLQNDDKKENNNDNQIVNEDKINEEINEIVNEVVSNEIVNEITNEIVENEVENTVSSETFEESPKTAEEKAIDIAKKDWGNETSANFSVEGMDGNGNYIVAVRDNNTVALAFYTVNVSNETFTKREMN